MKRIITILSLVLLSILLQAQNPIKVIKGFWYPGPGTTKTKGGEDTAVAFVVKNIDSTGMAGFCAIRGTDTTWFIINESGLVEIYSTSDSIVLPYIVGSSTGCSSYFIDNINSCDSLIICDSSFTVGTRTGNTGYFSFTAGLGNIASGNYSNAEGFNTHATGNYSHSEGEGCTSSGDWAHSEGYGNTASGFFTHAQGQNNTASGWGSNSEGYMTWAEGQYSSAGGHGSHSGGYISNAFGYGCYAKSNNEFVIGRYNDTTYSTNKNSWINTDNLFVIANGNGSSIWHNAFSVIKNGNVGINIYPTKLFDVNGVSKFRDTIYLTKTPPKASSGDTVLIYDGGMFKYSTSLNGFDSTHCWTKLKVDSVQACSPLIIDSDEKVIGDLTVTDTINITNGILKLTSPTANNNFFEMYESDVITTSAWMKFKNAVSTPNIFVPQLNFYSNITTSAQYANELRFGIGNSGDGAGNTGAICLIQVYKASSSAIVNRPLFQINNGLSGTNVLYIDASGYLYSPKLGGSAKCIVTSDASTGKFDTISISNIFVPSLSTTQDIVAANGITATQVANYSSIHIQSSTAGNCDISANPQIAAGTDGQILYFIGEHDTKTVQFDDGNGLQTAAGASRTLGLGDIFVVMYNAANTVWREISYSDN